MSILTDVLHELWKMFVTDLRLTLASLAVVALIGGGLSIGLIGPHLAAGLLLLAVVAVLTEAVLRPARQALTNRRAQMLVQLRSERGM